MANRPRRRRPIPVWQKIGLASITAVMTGLGVLVKDPNLPAILVFLQSCLFLAVIVRLFDRWMR